MRDRSKNRKPLQRGRVSNEVIQTVQVLKRASYSGGSVEQVLKSRVERLVKSDMIAVLRELQRQNESLLALQIFEVIRKEYWYKPQLFIYADMVMVLANNGLLEKVQQLCSYLKREVLDKDLVGFNVLLRNLMAFDLCQCAVDCFYLMEEAGCEPDETTFRILIKGLELRGEENLVDIIKMEVGKYFIEPYDFLEQEENEELKLTHW